MIWKKKKKNNVYQILMYCIIGNVRLICVSLNCAEIFWRQTGNDGVIPSSIYCISIVVLFLTLVDILLNLVPPEMVFNLYLLSCSLSIHLWMENSTIFAPGLISQNHRFQFNKVIDILVNVWFGLSYGV
jgi:hypothetical protein